MNNLQYEGSEFDPRDIPYEDGEEPQEDTFFDHLLRFLKRFGAFILILLLLYIYGIHQGILFQKTSEDVSVSEDRYTIIEELSSEPTLQLPVFVYVLKDRSDQHVNPERIIENASEIWDQAGIDFYVESVEEISMDETDIIAFLSNPEMHIASISDVDEVRINIFLTPSLGGLNGVAFRGVRTVAVAEYTTSYDYRVLAHEFGHILGLSHTQSSGDRLMFQGGHGTVISLKEAETARGEALKIQGL